MDSFSRKIATFNYNFIDLEAYKTVLTGLKNTLFIAVIGLLLGILIGTLLASVRVFPHDKGPAKFFYGLAELYIGLFRGTPMVVQLLIFWYVLMPLLEQNMSPVAASAMVFGLNSGAYVSEIMRSGIQSVDPGQMEGGRAVGMSYSKTMLSIIIPQAIKNILPTLGNEFISLIKETSVVSFIGASDLYVGFNMIGTNSYEFMIPYLVMALIYIVMIVIITLLIKVMERSLKKSDRSK